MTTGHSNSRLSLEHGHSDDGGHGVGICKQTFTVIVPVSLSLYLYDGLQRRYALNTIKSDIHTTFSVDQYLMEPYNIYRHWGCFFGTSTT